MQKGQIFRNGRSWLLGYNVKEERDGKTKWVRKVKKLAPISDKYRTPASVRHLANDLLAPQNSQRVRTEPTQTVVDFFDTVYLPHVKLTLRPATQDVYTQLYTKIKPHLGDIELREFDVPAADRLLRSVLANKYAHTTHRNIRNLLSAVFRYALRTGAIRHGNPFRDAVIPKGKPKGPCPAYSIEEIQRMLKVLPEPARTVVLVAALTGLRHAELRGLKWVDFTGDELHVRRSVWKTHVGETKTLASAAPVPVLPVVAKALKRHRRTAHCEFIFAGRSDQPLVLANVVRRDIIPALAKAKPPIKWHGWHGFRRGLASNLYSLGVSAKVIQRIMRHVDVATTLTVYVKTKDTEAQAAMQQLEKMFAAR
jgi:integrase